MNIIVPMAGMGKRMRPHTLTIPKPLLPIAGKPIVQRLVEDIAAMCDDPIEAIGFIIGDFGDQVEKDLLSVAESLGAKGSIHYQEEALGTAHAILCAKELMDGPVIVAFADTLFTADFKLDHSKDGILYTQEIENPEQFGVVVVDADNIIREYVEKPKEPVSNLAMIGIYFFKDGAWLRKELQYLIDNEIIHGGEYQLPDALRNMTTQGARFAPGSVKEWLDCGNKNATVYTNQRILELTKDQGLVSKTAKIKDSVIIEPCYLGDDVEISNSVIGPHVSVGNGSIIENSVIGNSIVQSHSAIRNANFSNSMIGNHVDFRGKQGECSIGDYSTYED